MEINEKTSLTLGTMARRAMLSYTHETSIHLYKPADITAPKVYLHINFWTDEIFRVVFSKERFPNPQENIERYKKDGFRISLWQYNFIPPNDDNENYHEAVKYGYLSQDFR